MMIPTNRRLTNCLTGWKCSSPDHIAVKYYKDYRSGSAKTLKSIQITLASAWKIQSFFGGGSYRHG